MQNSSGGRNSNLFHKSSLSQWQLHTQCKLSKWTYKTLFISAGSISVFYFQNFGPIKKKMGFFVRLNPIRSRRISTTNVFSEFWEIGLPILGNFMTVNSVTKLIPFPLLPLYDFCYCLFDSLPIHLRPKVSKKEMKEYFLNSEIQFSVLIWVVCLTFNNSSSSSVSQWYEFFSCVCVSLF